MVKKLVCHDLIQIWASLRISRQDSRNEVTGSVRNMNVVGKGVTILTDAAVRGFDVGRFEGRFAYDQCVDDDAKRPDVHLIRMATFALQHLWCDIVRCAANRALFLAVEVQLCCQSEVAKFYLHLVVEEKVAQFQVPVDDPVRMQVLQGVDDLHRVALDLKLVEPLTPLQKLVHRLVRAKFKQDVHILAVFEEMLEVAHILVLDTAVDFNLAHELLLGATLRERRLLDDLGRGDEIRLGIDEFEAFREATFAQEFSFEIPTDAKLSVLLLEFLLDNRLLLALGLS